MSSKARRDLLGGNLLGTLFFEILGHLLDYMMMDHVIQERT